MGDPGTKSYQIAFAFIIKQKQIIHNDFRLVKTPETLRKNGVKCCEQYNLILIK